MLYIRPNSINDLSQMIGCYLLKGASVHNFVVENTLLCLSLREGCDLIPGGLVKFC